MEPEQAIRLLERRFRSAWPRIPIIVGNEAVNFALDNFKRQSFLSHIAEPWPARKWVKRDNRRNRGLLIDTGRLRRSIRIVSVTQSSVTIGSDVPYAKAHNEGSRLGLIQSVKSFTRKSGVEVKAHTRKVNQNIPRRRFIGNSPYLQARIKRVVSAELMRALK